MNNNITFDDIKDDITPILTGFINNAIKDTTDAAKEYGKDIAIDFAKTLWACRNGDDVGAERNLKHLKVQLKQQAMIRSLNLNKNIRATIEKAIDVAWRIGLKMLIA